MGLASAIVLFATCLLAATLALIVAGLFERRRPASALLRDDAAGTVFFFDDTTLVDATDAARELLATPRRRGTHWDRLMAYLGPRFPGVAEALAGLPETGRATIRSTGPDPITLVAEWRGGLRKISLVAPHLVDTASLIDPLVRSAETTELRELRETADLAPLPIWRERSDGTVLWANDAYLRLSMDDLADEDPPWPPKRLFAHRPDAGAQRIGNAATPGSGWFEPVFAAAGSERIGYALPADAAVRTETTLREFLQTLARTFAHLSTGLAFFDSQGRLQVFNPALTDLTTLSVEFLSAKPSLKAFLDAMRERRMIPEPKNYKAWRQRITALEAVAESGLFEETWSLPHGMTYRAVGRPHPDGGLALMIEDISESIAIARSHRADLALSTAVIDAMDEAIAVFSGEASLVMANAGYRSLFDGESQQATDCDGLTEALAIWREATAPDPFWSALETAARGKTDRRPMAGTARLADGRQVEVRFVPLPAGGSLFGFTVPAARDRRESLFGVAGARRTTG
jgi:PAS domain-containing protein